ncbi:MAG: precorrin-3B C(17)-methyltransferase [Clostridium sp.]|nr:precorrin-3B C(17)-methyltransferase [Clostridium sp.]
MERNVLYIVGIGPGKGDMRTSEADRILSSAEVIAGYSVYNDLVWEDYPRAEFLTTPMRKERERCELALGAASQGKMTALICSGDAGVYGMAGLALEVGRTHFPEVEIKVIPGVTAALSGAALLGAPIGHDFAVISLSDALTPWELIEQRLRACAGAGMSIAIYNPESRTRKGYLAKACGILLELLPEDTVCGIAENIGREGEACRVLTLRELSEETVSMFATVFIGNRETADMAGKMVTPRGYRR